MKVTEKCLAAKGKTVIACDFSTPRSGDVSALEEARRLDVDFISVNYNPGRSVRADSVAAARAIRERMGKEVIFTLATRDMNKLALESRLLGAQMLGLENVFVVGGDEFTDKERASVKEVDDFSPTELIGAIAAMNQGVDYKGTKLAAPTDFCIGASIDLGKGIEQEAALAHRKAEAGAQFFMTQAVYGVSEVDRFNEALGGKPLEQPVFWGVQVPAKEGVAFGQAPEWVRRDLERGRSGVDLALQVAGELMGRGVRTLYIVPPIFRGGARDYRATQDVVRRVRG